MTLLSPVSHELAAPESVGIDPRRLRLFLDRVRLEVDAGPLPSAQVAVARDGRLVAFETYGDATSGKRYILQSVGRTVVAAAVWKLISDGLLDTGERVAGIIPEFGTNGKDVVTVGQVLTHTAGFPRAPMRPEEGADRAARVERVEWGVCPEKRDRVGVDRVARLSRLLAGDHGGDTTHGAISPRAMCSPGSSGTSSTPSW